MSKTGKNRGFTHSVHMCEAHTQATAQAKPKGKVMLLGNPLARATATARDKARQSTSNT